MRCIARSSRVLVLCVVLGAGTSACSLERASIAGQPNGGPGPVDASGDRDASVALDGGERVVDAALTDAAARDDAAAPGDAGTDPPIDAALAEAGTDAGAPDAGGPCSPGAPERCDGRDEDCDDLVDEGSGDCGCDRVLGAQGRSYLFCTATRTYDDARAFCAARGYDLVVIDDEDENAFVRAEQRTRGSDFYIGLDDRGAERTFVWVDGRTAWRNGTSELFTAWAGGQPDDFFGEDCVQMRENGRWNDVDCGDGFRHVCESALP
ncbi:C-type lectin domain-containing protein [Sandaracinus amylolyticus]|uniref:C-type lectin domain-containing protein n=1 Tax=Sandaracinus amylolyticus TaxID=927083 RepID=A0A0F6VZX4_9BACT|nr:C-type lectin domain-containing protein [Sandaracinus amylolyticus]AKF03702.1 hypothetical protein DB32_000851 [Sandaracinus amylolyticus]